MNKLEIEERRKQVRKLYLTTNKTIEEIAGELHAGVSTIRKDIKELKNEGKLDKGKRIDIEQINEVYKKKENMSEGRKKQLKKTSKRNLEELRRLCDDFYDQKETKQFFRKYMADCQNRCKEGTLEEEELSIIEKIAMVTEEYQSIVVYLNACIELKKYEEAAKFANGQIHSETLTKEEKEKIKEIREKVNEIRKKQIAIATLERGQGVKVAIQQSGLPETMVLRLNHQLLLQSEKRNHPIEAGKDDELEVG